MRMRKERNAAYKQCQETEYEIPREEIEILEQGSRITVIRKWKELRKAKGMRNRVHYCKEEGSISKERKGIITRAE